MDNLVTVLMSQKQITLQAAMDQAVAAMRACMQSFVTLAGSGGAAAAGRNEQRYVQGLRDWIVGWAHWIYETNRYFLENAEDVKAFGWVFLLPREDEGAGES